MHLFRFLFVSFVKYIQDPTTFALVLGTAKSLSGLQT